jgi:hypothetical protein
MSDDGLHDDGSARDSVYGIELPIGTPGNVLRYYVQAIANDEFGTMVFEPPAEHLANEHVTTFQQAEQTSIVINELMAQNNTAISDPQGEYDDWIELKNTSDETIDLSGMYLSDKLENPLKWKIPDNTLLEPGNYLIVWADEDGNAETGLHANFKLSAGGEIVLLFNSDDNGNTLLDSVSFGTQTADQSYGRSSDDSTEWQIFSNPTPGSQNGIFSAVKNKSITAQKFHVWPAYPNPFNPETTISFSIPEKLQVNITIFNTHGQEITTLIDAMLPAGNHSVQWHPDNIPSGLYFYRIISGSHTVSKKLMYIK